MCKLICNKHISNIYIVINRHPVHGEIIKPHIIYVRIRTGGLYINNTRSLKWNTYWYAKCNDILKESNINKTGTMKLTTYWYKKSYWSANSVEKKKVLTLHSLIYNHNTNVSSCSLGELSQAVVAILIVRMCVSSTPRPRGNGKQVFEN